MESQLFYPEKLKLTQDCRLDGFQGLSLSDGTFLISGVLIGLGCLERWAIRWALGCVNSRPADSGSQVAVFTQPRTLFITHLCMWDKSLCTTTLT